jgi:antitoxin component of MazEF toxin-antitoxin module
MLKKLVKYGNSNALILDKAILELLEIEEGSILKIKTDGTSIIVTPHVKATSEQVQETFTHGQANIEAAVKDTIKRYKDLSKDKQEQLEKEYQTLIQRRLSLSTELHKNTEFMDQVQQIAKLHDTHSPAYLAAYKELRSKYCPEAVNIDNEIAHFEVTNSLALNITNKPLQTLTAKQQASMEQEFFAAHTKNTALLKACADLLNNPEYQHQAQLLAEKYAADKNSNDYLQALSELNDAYVPGYAQYQEELKNIASHHPKTKNK